MIPHFIVCTERGTNAFTSMNYYLHTYSRLKTPFKGNVLSQKTMLKTRVCNRYDAIGQYQGVLSTTLPAQNLDQYENV